MSIPIPFTGPLVFKTRFIAGWINPPHGADSRTWTCNTWFLRPVCMPIPSYQQIYGCGARIRTEICDLWDRQVTSTLLRNNGTPSEIRTHVSAVKKHCPNQLDDRSWIQVRESNPCQRCHKPRFCHWTNLEWYT